jgi:hypothetical protein
MVLQSDITNKYGCLQDWRLRKKVTPAGYYGPTKTFLECVSNNGNTQPPIIYKNTPTLLKKRPITKLRKSDELLYIQQMRYIYGLPRWFIFIFIMTISFILYNNEFQLIL